MYSTFDHQQGTDTHNKMFKKITLTQAQTTILQFGNKLDLSVTKSLTVTPTDYQFQWYDTIQWCNQYCT